MAVMIRRWLPDVAAGTFVLAVGCFEFAGEASRYSFAGVYLWGVMAGTAVATGLSRRQPGLALLLVWLIAAGQTVTGTPILFTQVAIGAVAFGTARWGRIETLWLGLLSIPIGAVLVVLLLKRGSLTLVPEPASYLTRVVDLGANWQIAVAALGTTLLGTPWLAGAMLRISARARDQSLAAEANLAQVQAEREQAKELAQMQEENARLARDVHDVVGHSLAVILAQAEAGQYLPDDNPSALKETLATIATSARTSLQDVRQVLSATRDRDGPDSDDLNGLIEGVRGSGHEVVSTQLGHARPLPPEQAVTAFRVLQEMLTNAMKHGRRGAAISVLRHWTDGDREVVLVIEVRNQADTDSADAPASAGQGLSGMRQRVAAVGGRLDVRREGDVFTATAWIPVRT
jgi:signal transduction histidine kinase